MVHGPIGGALEQRNTEEIDDKNITTPESFDKTLPAPVADTHSTKGTRSGCERRPDDAWQTPIHCDPFRWRSKYFKSYVVINNATPKP